MEAGPQAKMAADPGPSSSAEGRTRLGSGLVKDSLCGKIASQGQRVLCVGSHGVPAWEEHHSFRRPARGRFYHLLAI